MRQELTSRLCTYYLYSYYCIGAGAAGALSWHNVGIKALIPGTAPRDEQGARRHSRGIVEFHPSPIWINNHHQSRWKRHLDRTYAKILPQERLW